MKPGTGKKLPGDNNSGCQTGSDTGNELPSVSWADTVSRGERRLFVVLHFNTKHQTGRCQGPH
jgi:hypothetical protein